MKTRITLKQAMNDLLTPEALAAHRYSTKEIVRMPISGIKHVHDVLFNRDVVIEQPE